MILFVTIKMNLITKNKITWLFLLQLLLLLALPLMPCFSELGKLPIRIWDEARQAHNAYEMYRSHNYWVPTFDGLPDTFGTKPAVLIWMQVASMKLFGVNEFALRFPSAMSSWLLGILVMLFVWNYFKSYHIAIVAGILLFTSEGLIRTHVARTADFDAPLAFFSVLACVCFFVFLNNKKPIFWYLSCFAIAFAVWMKGTAGLLFLPSLLLYALLQGKVKELLKSRHTYVGNLIFLVLVIGYYLLRNAFQPGYLSLVVKSEWQSMYLKPAQGHAEEFWFYAINFYSKGFKYYWYLLPLGIVSIIFIKNDFIKKVALFSLCCLGGFFLIISVSATKLFWYDAPLYPFVVFLCACFFYLIREILVQNKVQLSQRNAIQLFLVLALGAFGFSILKPRILNSEEDYQEKYFYTMATYLQEANRKNVDLSGYKFMSGQTYAPHHTFYLKQMKANGQRVSSVVFDRLELTDSVMLFEINMQALLLQKFYTTQLRCENDIFAYRLDSLKSNDAKK